MEKYSHFNLEHFGNKLSFYRKQKDMTQAELAKRLDVSATTINFYEKGRRDPGCSTYLDLANLLGIDPIQFFIDDKAFNLLMANDNLFDINKPTSEKERLIAGLYIKLRSLNEQELKALNIVLDSMIGQNKLEF